MAENRVVKPKYHLGQQVVHKAGSVMEIRTISEAYYEKDKGWNYKTTDSLDTGVDVSEDDIELVFKEGSWRATKPSGEAPRVSLI